MTASSHGERSKKIGSETALRTRRSSRVSASAPAHSLDRINVLHQTLGNQGMLRRLQAKLAISEPGDAAEREADRVADTVMSKHDHGPGEVVSAAQAHPAEVQRKCAACESDDEERVVQRKEASGARAIATPPIVERVLNSGGQPLDPKTRGFMEGRFGHDFSDVRVHTDASAAESARAVGALAYTVGDDLVLAAGRYQPDSEAGRHLIAHELAHVVQQRDYSDRGCSAPYFAETVLRRKPDAAEIARVKLLNDEYYEAVRLRRWKEAADFLNGFNDTDIAIKLNELSPAQLEVLRNSAMGYSRITGPIEKKVAGQVEAARVKKLNDDYSAAVALGQWGQAANLLNGFNDTDIMTKLKELKTRDELDAMIAAAGKFERVRTRAVMLRGLKFGSEGAFRQAQPIYWLGAPRRSTVSPIVELPELQTGPSAEGGERAAPGTSLLTTPIDWSAGLQARGLGAERPVLRAYYPDANELPKGTEAFDGWSGGKRTVIFQQGRERGRGFVPSAGWEIEGGRAISIKTVDVSSKTYQTTSGMYQLLGDILGQAATAGERGISRREWEGDHFFTVKARNPDEIVVHFEFNGPLNPTQEAAVAQAQWAATQFPGQKITVVVKKPAAPPATVSRPAGDSVRAGMVSSLRWAAGGAVADILASLLVAWLKDQVEEYLIKRDTKQLEPEMQRRLNALSADVATLQLEHPGQKLYGNVTLIVNHHTLETAGRSTPETFETRSFMEGVLPKDTYTGIEIGPVTVGLQPVDRKETRTERKELSLVLDSIDRFDTSTSSLEIQPHGKEQLIAVVQDRIRQNEESVQKPLASRTARQEETVFQERQKLQKRLADLQKP